MLAQVGVGTTSPDNNTVLDVNSSTKGMLIPRMNTTARETLRSNSPAQGTMVYDTDLNVMFVFYSGEWYATNPWKTEFRDDGNNDTAHMTTMTAAGIKHGRVGIGVASPQEKLDVNGKVKATEFIGNGAVPIGTIVMWSGNTAPAGWALCNGQVINGITTPDLRNRFIAGYNPLDARYNQPGNLSTGDTTKGMTGGVDSYSLSVAQLPAHSHTGTTNPAGAHSHTYWYRNAAVEGAGGSGQDWAFQRSENTSTAPNHTHSFTTANTGSGASIENRPNFYVLAYIIRVQ